MGDRRRNQEGDVEPPHSRLFVLASRDLNEEDIRKAFKSYGNIRDVWGVKDRNTGESKGIFYIRYTKTSEAAKALENMKGKVLGSRGIKVMIASSREQGSSKSDNEEDNVKRLFIVVPKSTSDNEIYDYFKQFGDLEYASIVKDRSTNQNKGFAYVKYLRFSDAAIALEECDRKYKAVFAQPRKPKEELQKEKEFHNNSFQNVETPPSHYRNDNRFPPLGFKEDGSFKLSVVTSPSVNQDQIWKLFDIVPSMDYCQIQYHHEDRGNRPNAFEVVYTNYEWATYALEKFHGFEYPPGQRLIVKADCDQTRPFATGGGESSTRSKRPAPTSASPSSTELAALAETIAHATSLIQKAGLSPELLQSKLGGLLPDPSRSDYCNKSLPAAKPLADKEDKTEARCFIVCSPTALSPTVLSDVFSRFGSLIDVYMLNNKNCGYAKYASKQSAEEAIATLHGAEVLGVRLKVMEAEERRPPVKKQRIVGDDEDEWK